MITGGDLRQSRLDVGYKTFTISPWIHPLPESMDREHQIATPDKKDTSKKCSSYDVTEGESS